MTKDVLVTVQGIQKLPQIGETPREVVSKAEGIFYEKNGKKYILFEETVEETEHTIKNTIKLDANGVDLIKHGALVTHMVFETGVDFAAEYKTPFGSMMLNVVTKDLKVYESEDTIEVRIIYELWSNKELLSDCMIMINAKSVLDH